VGQRAGRRCASLLDECPIGRVFAYLLRLSDVRRIDLEQALEGKIAQNTLKYPVQLCRGSAIKYTDLPGKETP
jgi:hypothetical protein